MESGTSLEVWQPFAIPSKYDVIPIHNSDRGSFKRCRRYWDWNSPARHNLTIRADILGINLPMWFGTGVHYALERYYTPGLRHSPVESFKTWFDIQWRGGLVGAEWLDLVHDLNPEPIKPGDKSWVMEGELYKIRGLQDILPDPNTEEFDELFETGINMLKYYEEYAPRNDDFEVIVAEHNFSVPIWDYENDRILCRTDLREESPNYGKELEVHARGRLDAIYRRPTGRLGILDHKTAMKLDDNFEVKLETDEQATSYLWAAEIEAQYYDLPHKGQPMEEVIFNVMRKAYPRQPTELKNGMFSVDKQNESTTYEILMEWISKNMPGVKLTDKQQGYVDYLREVGDEQFIIRRPSRRNRHQLVNAGKRIYQETLDMLSPDLRIYPNLRNDFTCLGCQFRAPCVAKESGADWEQLIADNYSINKDR